MDRYWNAGVPPPRDPPRILLRGRISPITSSLPLSQESPEISRAAITEAADAIARRFEALTSATGDSMCTTAGSLDPPMENGICAYDGGWDCSQCSCYDTNFEPDNPFAVTPVSSYRLYLA